MQCLFILRSYIKPLDELSKGILKVVMEQLFINKILFHNVHIDSKLVDLRSDAILKCSHVVNMGLI